MDHSQPNTVAGSSSHVGGDSSRRIGDNNSERSLSPARTIPTPSDPGIQEVNERYRDREPPGPSPTSPQFVDALESPTIDSPRRVTRGQARRERLDSSATVSQPLRATPSESRTEDSMTSRSQGGAFGAARSAIRNAFGLQAGSSTGPGNEQSNGRVEVQGHEQSEEGGGSTTQSNTPADTGAAAGNSLYPDIAVHAQTASTDPSPPTTTGTSQDPDDRDPPTPGRGSDIMMQDAPPIRSASQPHRQHRRGGDDGGNDQPPPPVRREPREGWACDNGTWKQVEAYRPRGSGYQVMLKERAPNRQYWNYEWVAAHRVGGAGVVNGYIAHMRSSGIDEVETFRTGSIDLLREMTNDDYEGITGVAPVRRYQHREFGWEKMPAQDIQVKFGGQRDPIWYPKAEVVRQFGRETVEGDIADFWQRSGITPPVMNPPDLVGPRRANRTQRFTRNEIASSPSEPAARASRRATPQEALQQPQQQVQARQERTGILNRIAAARRQDVGLPTPEHTPAPEHLSNRTPSSDAELQTLQNIISRHPEFLELVRNMRP